MFANEFKGDRQIVMAAVWEDGMALQFADKFKGNSEVVLRAAKNDLRSLQFADKNIFKDTIFMKELFSHYALYTSLVSSYFCHEKGIKMNKCDENFE